MLLMSVMLVFIQKPHRKVITDSFGISDTGGDSISTRYVLPVNSTCAQCTVRTSRQQPNGEWNMSSLARAPQGSTYHQYFRVYNLADRLDFSKVLFIYPRCIFAVTAALSHCAKVSYRSKCTERQRKSSHFHLYSTLYFCSGYYRLTLVYKQKSTWLVLQVSFQRSALHP